MNPHEEGDQDEEFDRNYVYHNPDPYKGPITKILSAVIEPIT